MSRSLRRHALVVALLVAVGMTACGRQAPSTSPEALVSEASTLLDQNKAQEALDLLNKALARADSAKGRYLLGNAYSELERFEEAQAAYLKALELDPAYADARSNLAVAYYMLGRPAEAEETIRQVLSEHPQDADLHYNLGTVLAAQGRTAEAEAAFLEARRLDDSLPQVYLGLGVLYRDMGRPEEAMASLRRYLELSDDATWRAEAERILNELETISGSK
ncbi:MAG: tetratricopeptide repeat protein [Chloroflexi bacterium]|jgi:tetratricopeptide (TPR) repeat protein|nr:tetratricopeptide repeat protein [Chloroflexota bacterium]